MAAEVVQLGECGNGNAVIAQPLAGFFACAQFLPSGTWCGGHCVSPFSLE